MWRYYDRIEHIAHNMDLIASIQTYSQTYSLNRGHLINHWAWGHRRAQRLGNEITDDVLHAAKSYAEMIYGAINLRNKAFIFLRDLDKRTVEIL